MWSGRLTPDFLNGAQSPLLDPGLLEGRNFVSGFGLGSFVFAHVYIVLFSFYRLVGPLFLLNLSHKQEEVALDSSSPPLGEQASVHFVLVCVISISAFCLFVLFLLLSSTPMYEFSNFCTSLMNVYFVGTDSILLTFSEKCDTVESIWPAYAVPVDSVHGKLNL